ncbi:S-adenosyl-L-methionine-dependent methyltransferase [Aspergillus crustosus]
MSQNIYNEVQAHYGEIAKRSNTVTTQQDPEEQIAKAFGYTGTDLSSLPSKANMGLSCGNPTAFANMKPGETILDLGSGGGIDVLLAARKVGPEGKAIGVDMTEEMITLSTSNAESAKLTNTLFIKSTITAIPLPDSSIDCIISNCVINLVPKPDKQCVFHEIARLLRPGGRIAISDILARRELPEAVVSDMAMHVGCVAGASLVGEYEEFLRVAGFQDLLIVDTKSDLNLYKQFSYLPQGQAGCCGSGAAAKGSVDGCADVNLNEWAGSFQIYAVKGGRDTKEV